ncbi:9919_t:CDS:2, partial [Gigaspora rosea]
DFIIAVRLAAKAQNGQNLSLDDINTGVCLPQFNGYPVNNNIEFSNFGVNEGRNAINFFFSKPGLSRTTLKDIWSLANNKNKGYLTLEDFIIAVRLIAKAQNGQNLSLDDINTDRERHKQMFVALNPNNGGVLD